MFALCSLLVRCLFARERTVTEPGTNNERSRCGRSCARVSPSPARNLPLGPCSKGDNEVRQFGSTTAVGLFAVDPRFKPPVLCDNHHPQKGEGITIWITDCVGRPRLRLAIFGSRKSRTHRPDFGPRSGWVRNHRLGSRWRRSARSIRIQSSTLAIAGGQSWCDAGPGSWNSAAAGL
jgi:hypothetical protein